MNEPNPKKTVETVTFIKWIVWKHGGEKRISWREDGADMSKWPNRYDTGKRESYEVPVNGT